MANRLREIIDSVIFAGLKPSGSAAARVGSGWRGRLALAWDRLLSGSTPVDPFYLSNRTWKQKFRIGAIVCTPILIVVGIFIYSLYTPPPAVEKQFSEPTAAEVAARTRIVPDDFKVPQNGDLELMEVFIDRSTTPHHVAGTLKNISSRHFGIVEISFDLTDANGSQIGGAKTLVADMGPGRAKQFSFPIPQRNAAFVLVRETHPTL